MGKRCTVFKVKRLWPDFWKIDLSTHLEQFQGKVFVIPAYTQVISICFNFCQLALVEIVK